MLNKEICRQCIKKHHDVIIRVGGATGEMADKLIDDMWEEGRLCCSAYWNKTQFHFGEIRITQEPPENCYYILEQKLSNAEKENL